MKQLKGWCTGPVLYGVITVVLAAVVVVYMRPAFALVSAEEAEESAGSECPLTANTLKWATVFMVALVCGALAAAAPMLLQMARGRGWF